MGSVSPALGTPRFILPTTQHVDYKNSTYPPVLVPPMRWHYSHGRGVSSRSLCCCILSIIWCRMTSSETPRMPPPSYEKSVTYETRGCGSSPRARTFMDSGSARVVEDIDDAGGLSATGGGEMRLDAGLRTRVGRLEIDGRNVFVLTASQDTYVAYLARMPGRFREIWLKVG